MGLSPSPEPLKRRRITRACDKCHRSGVKCSNGPSSALCGPCAAFGTECTYNRPIKRRGPVPRGPRVPGASATRLRSTSTGPDNWTYEAITSPEIVNELVDTYHKIVYPILPYFHWPTFSSHVHNQRYMTDRSFYAVTMAVCAIATARVRDGAAIDLTTAATPSLPSATPPSEAFYDAILRSFPADLSQAQDFDYKRAKVLLAMLCIQYGQVKKLMTHLGDYMTLCANDGFHNEGRWPLDIPETEVQERRRLFWGCYTIDVYSATTWGGVVRHREAQSTVLYPAEVCDDDEITEVGIIPRAGLSNGRSSFLRGWNFTTDLYRILEHALDQLRARKLYADDTSPVTAFYSARPGPSAAETLDLVAQLYDDLPAEFKGAKAMTGQVEEDRYGFQAADIIVTLQTVKMVMTGLEDATVEKRCAIAGELLDALATIPTAYIQAISSPILHHLAGVGHLLGSVIQSPLSQWSYIQVRNVLLAMTDLLSSLESTLSFVPGIAEKLRAHVSRIDQYMTAAALDHSRRAQVFHHALPAAAWTSSTALSHPALTGVGAVIPSTQSIRESQNWSVPLKRQTDTSVAGGQEQPPTGDFGESAERRVPFESGFSSLVDASVSSDAQFTLPNDLLIDWPFDMGQGDAFDFLGDFQQF